MSARWQTLALAACLGLGSVAPASARPSRAAVLAYNQGTASLQKNAFEAALPDLQRAVALAPKEPTFLSQLAFALHAVGRHDESLTLLTKALELDGKHANWWARYAFELDAAGQVQASVAPLRKALELDGKQAAWWIRLGSTCNELGQLTEAVQAWKQGIALGYEQAESLLPHVCLLEAELASQAGPGAAPDAKDYLVDAARDGLRRWPLKPMPLRVFVAPGNAILGYRLGLADIVKEAFADWSAVLGSRVRFAFVDDPKQAQIRVDWTDDPTRLLTRAEGGHATAFGIGHDLTDARIVILLSRPGQPRFADDRIREVALHEVGHALGLQGHSRNPGDIQFHSCVRHKGSERPELSARDKQTVIALYAAQPDAWPIQDRSGATRSRDEDSKPGQIERLVREYRIAHESGDLGAQIQKLLDVRRLEPDHPSLEGLGTLYLNHGVEALQQGDLKLAEERFDLAQPWLVRYDDRKTLALLARNRAYVFEQTGRQAEAEKLRIRAKVLQAEAELRP